MFRRFAPLGVLAAVVLAGCGGHSSRTVTRTVTTTVTAPAPRVTYIPPQSSVTPEGARLQAPPSTFSLTPSSMHVSAKGLALIEGFEGFEGCPYWDVYGKVWSRGFGETDWSGDFGGICISRAQATANLRGKLAADFEWAIRDLDVALNQNQWDALCSFTWNLGAGILDQGTPVGDALRARDFSAATKAMLGYVYAGGVALPGLITRRQDEVNLFNTPVAKAKPKVPYVAADERRWRHEWDQVSDKHTRRADAVRARLRPLMLKRAHIIEYRAHHERDGWFKLNRQARHYELAVRLGLAKGHR
jgi:lysozyme